MTQRFHKFVPWLLLLLLVLLFFWKLAFTDMILARGDTFSYFYPYWDIRNETMREGDLPLWSPDIFMGVPLLANSQIGTFYPLNWVTIPFQAPDAIRLSLLFHILWAGTGAYLLARKALRFGQVASLGTAIIFAFSGYLGAHVEQINQLQGLSWMPWFFLCFHLSITQFNKASNQKFLLRWLANPFVYLLAFAYALQIFTGHTQTVFITSVGLGIYALLFTGYDHIRIRLKTILQNLSLLALAVVFGVILALPQIIPTMELTGMSNRGSGLNVQEATAFSLPLTYVGQSLLPNYDSQLFGEYVGTIGIIGLGLALLGGFVILSSFRQQHLRSYRHLWLWIVITLVGLLFAFGRYNPLYLLLAELPGFNLFRVPARWLSLFTLGSAVLAGTSIQALRTGYKPGWRVILLIVAAIALLILLTIFVFDINPVDINGSAEPTTTTILIWCIALALLALILIGNRTSSKGSRYAIYAVIPLIIFELFLASRIMPYNDLVPRDVYLDQRFTVSQLQALNEERIVPGRMLSISELQFDPGNVGVLQARYEQSGMSERAIRHALVANKKQEVIFPNLPLTWDISSADGFDGGILPTIYYSQFTSPILPEGELRTVDGRLGEILARPECRDACIPDLNWSEQADIQYLLTDKVYDIWREDIAYDTTLPVNVANSEQVSFASTHEPFEADQIHLIYSGDTPATTNPLSELTDDSMVEGNLRLAEFSLEPQLLNDITINADGESTIFAATLVDSRTGDFLQLAPEPYERILSSDVKLYENTSVNESSRAFLTRSFVTLPDTWQGSEDALAYLPETTVIHTDMPLAIDSSDEILGAEVDFIQYDPTYIEMNVQTDEDAILILKDAYYPGWQATIDNDPTKIYRANIMFRAIEVPAGSHTITFTFQSDSWTIAILIGAAFWLLFIIILLVLWRRERSFRRF